MSSDGARYAASQTSRTVVGEEANRGPRRGRYVNRETGLLIFPIVSEIHSRQPERPMALSHGLHRLRIQPRTVPATPAGFAVARVSNGVAHRSDLGITRCYSTHFVQEN